jgi:uncharacterized membrane protein
MDRTPSLWRAWSPVVLQVAGVLVVAVGTSLAPAPVAAIALVSGVIIWLFGFTHGRRLANRLRNPQSNKRFKLSRELKT